ncbi:MAG: hypothetical protein V4787_02295 [Pseudomonadota bacterium]
MNSPANATAETPRITAPQGVRLAFGHLDFQLDMGMRFGADGAELAPVRFALVAASRAKLCIHPAQIAAVEEVLAPSARELDWARRVVAQAQERNGETFSLDGKMVDLPVVLLAQKLLLRNETTG